MKGFKNTGRGPKSGHSFSSKAGFSGSTGRSQSVRGYTRAVPKTKFASGGMVVAKGTDGGSALIRRTKPVTGFDAEAGGKGPLRPGFSKGGKACYAEGGKVETLGAAIRMVKQLMAQGNSAQDAAAKAARRYNVSASQLKAPAGPTGGGGMPAEKQMLAKGGIATIGRAMQARGSQSPPPARVAPRGAPVGALTSAARAAESKGGTSFTPAPQSQKVPGRVSHHGNPGGYGYFGRNPRILT